MNKILKYIVLALNVYVFYKTYVWFNNPNDPKSEPFIAMISQGIAILLLFFEDKIKTKITNIENSDILTSKEVDTKIDKVKDSKIEVR